MSGPTPIDRTPWPCASLALALIVLWPRTSLADSSHACAEAYERAQIERKAGHITAAIENLTICSGEPCPKFIRKDCIQWLGESQNAQPSVVFSVQHDGVDLSSAEISCDGRVVTRIVDGKAVAIDPGPHVFVFRVQGFLPVERQLIVREGEHNRLVEAELKETSGKPAPSLVPGAALSPSGESYQKSSELGGAFSQNSRSLRLYGSAGLGILGVSGFAVFGLWGESQKNNLERTCSPYCQSSQVDEVRTKYIVADACLAVGVASLGLATYWFLTGSSRESSAPATSVAVSPLHSGRGGVVNISSSF
jgi:hypothetical protein